MQLFIDSADVAELRAAADSGLIDGVTTNPSLIAKSGRNMKEAIAEICAIIPGPVSAEAVATDVEGMLAEGRYLARIASNVVVKLPLTENGLRACSILSGEGTKVNITLCFSAVQVMLEEDGLHVFVADARDLDHQRRREVDRTAGDRTAGLLGHRPRFPGKQRLARRTCETRRRRPRDHRQRAARRRRHCRIGGCRRHAPSGRFGRLVLRPSCRPPSSCRQVRR